MKESPTPVAEFALKNQLPVITPETLKNPDLLAEVTALNPVFFVVSSYGKIIPASWLKVAKHNLNVHPSLLPLYRGASPINGPILNGDSETAISIAEITDKLDAGDIFYQKKVALPGNIDALTLETLLAELSENALAEVFKNIEDGKLSRTRQVESISTYAPKLKKEDGLIIWANSAAKIDAQIRALIPWPSAYTFLDGELLQLTKASALPQSSSGVLPGTIIAVEKQGGILIQTGDGVLNALTVKPAGKKFMSGADFARGKRLAPGIKFSNAPDGTPS